MLATVWQIMNMKFTVQWPETEIIWICWNLLGKKSLQVDLFTCDAWFCRQLLAMFFKSFPDQIKLLGWLTHTLLGLKKRKDIFQCSSAKGCSLKLINFCCLNSWKTDNVVLCFISKLRCVTVQQCRVISLEQLSVAEFSAE